MKKLIQLKEQWIIVDTEVRYTDIPDNSWLHKGFAFRKNFRYDSNDVWYKQIIASCNPQLEGTIPINNIEEIKQQLGIVDVNDIVHNYCKENSINGVDYKFVKRDFLAGYNQAISNNQKKYSEEDMEQLRNVLLKGALTNMSCSSAIVEFDKFIQSIQPKTEWECEIDESNNIKLI